MSGRGARGIALTGAALLAIAGVGPTHAVPNEAPAAYLHVAVHPGAARIGERVHYRGWIAYPSQPQSPQWLPPEAQPGLTWGTLVPRLVRGRGPADFDTLFADVPAQGFRLGASSITGLRFRGVNTVPGGSGRLPVVTLLVRSVLAPADSNAELRPARGPMAAPWWERVPWRWVVVGIALLALVTALVVWRRRRKKPEVAPASVTLDPAARARQELAELRALQLPEHERFAEHAFHLTRILRRYLEAVLRVPRPGHTTPELVEVLGRARLGAADVERVAALLRVWDRLKFARGLARVDECARAEDAVEDLIRELSATVAHRAA